MPLPPEWFFLLPAVLVVLIPRRPVRSRPELTQAALSGRLPRPRVQDRLL